MSAPSHWYEPHGLHSQPEQNQAWRSGTRHQRADTPDPSASTDYSLLLSCLITTSTHPPLFMQQYYSYTVGGCQAVKDVYLVVRVCRSECVSVGLKKRIVGAVSAWMCIPSLDCISVAKVSAESLLKKCGLKNLVFFSVSSSIKLGNNIHKLFCSLDT